MRDERPKIPDPELVGVTIMGVVKRPEGARRKLILHIKTDKFPLIRVPVYCSPEHSKNVVKNLKRLL